MSNPNSKANSRANEPFDVGSLTPICFIYGLKKTLQSNITRLKFYLRNTLNVIFNVKVL